MRILFTPRIFASAVVLAFLPLNAIGDENREKTKVPDAPQKASAKKCEPEKPPEKELAVPSWVTKHFLGTPVAKRIAKLQAELDAAIAKRGPAREEAEKARHVANELGHTVDDLDKQIRWLESERFHVLQNGEKQRREVSLDKADLENAQRISRLEGQVRELTSRLEAANKQHQEKK